MKKAKMLFTAIAALTLVGGALAFKAKNFGIVQLYTTTNAVAGATCPNTGTVALEVVSGDPLSAFATITKNHSCINLNYATE